MAEAQMCDNCYEELGEEPIQRGDKVYCCEACAFEASRSVDCAGWGCSSGCKRAAGAPIPMSPRRLSKRHKSERRNPVFRLQK